MRAEFLEASAKQNEVSYLSFKDWQGASEAILAFSFIQISYFYRQLKIIGTFLLCAC